MILVTRPIEESINFRQKLIDSKINMPVLIEPMMEIQLYNKHIPKYPNYIITSINALKYISKFPISLEANIFVPGSKTRDIARKMGFINIKTSQTENAEGISCLLQEDEQYLYLRGKNISFDFKNHNVNDLEIYNAKAVNKLSEHSHQLISKCSIKIISFFSLRTAEIFETQVNNDRIKQITKIVVLSQKIADYLIKQNWKNIHIAENKNAISMIKKIKELT